MKVLVVDASAMVETLIGLGERAQFSRATIVLADSLAAPDLLPYEVSNVLRRLERSGKISRASAIRGFTDLQRTPVTYWPFSALSGDIWGQRGQISSYDAAHVALAQNLDTPLLTTDKRLVSIAKRFVKILCPEHPAPAP